MIIRLLCGGQEVTVVTHAPGKQPCTSGILILTRWERAASLRSLPHGSACDPVIAPVLKTGGRCRKTATVGSTPTRFRHFSTSYSQANHSQISLASARPSAPPWSEPAPSRWSPRLRNHRGMAPGVPGFFARTKPPKPQLFRISCHRKAITALFSQISRPTGQASPPFADQPLFPPAMVLFCLLSVLRR